MDRFQLQASGGVNDPRRVNQTAPRTRQDAPAPAGKSNKDIQVYYNDVYKPSIKQNDPIARNDPNSPEKNIIKVIDAARSTLDGAFYDIDSPEIVDAWIRAKNRGVQVRLVTDTDNLVEKDDPTKPRLQVQRLKQAGIPVLDDKRSALMHDKFMVSDKQIVWTGSTNLTDGSLYHHNNDAIKFNSSQLAADYEAEFERLYAGKFSKTPHDIPYAQVNVGGTIVKPFFSPNGNGMTEVLDELKGAKRSVRFMTFSLSDKDIGKLLIEKARSGLTVEGIFDTRLAANKASLYPVLKEAGIPVYKDGNEALLHHKVIIIDDSTVITGSYNFSENAQKANDENFVVMKNAPDMVRKYMEIYNKTLNAAKNNHPPYTPPEGAKPTKPGKDDNEEPAQPATKRKSTHEPEPEKPATHKTRARELVGAGRG